MLRKSLFSLLILIVLIGSLAYFYKPQSVINEVLESVKEINPISLEALMNKDFDGRDLNLGQVLDDNPFYTRYYVTYKSGALTISGILNIPKGDIPTGGWPVLFLNHGHIDTSVYTNGRGLRREQDYLARQGFAVFHSDYRNHAQSDKDSDNDLNIRIGYIEDVINAVLSVKNSNIDSLSKERFGMLGHSMGGGISQAVMVVKPDLVDAIVLYAPVSSDVTDSYNKWTVPNKELTNQINERHGSPELNPEFWNNLSPRTYFDRVKIPVIIFHGTNDKDCDIEWSRETRDLLVNEEKSIQLVEYINEGHEFSFRFNDFMKQTSEFYKNNI